MNLRVYDITGRLFDGTNAHSYFDHRSSGTIASGSSTSASRPPAPCVEVGLKSPEGYFVKIARCGRVEFPRSEPVGGGRAEWLSVRTATGDVGSPRASGAAPPPGGPRTDQARTLAEPAVTGGGAPGGPGGVGAARGRVGIGLG